MDELTRLLEETNNEAELFEKLLEATLSDDKTAIRYAARIQAGRDIRFDIEKIAKEQEKRNNS